VSYPTRFDSRDAERALKGSGIEVPRLDTYAWRLWDYWERNLDPDLFVDRSLRGRIEGKVVLITGGSSGIGRATAEKVAAAGAVTIIVARGEEELFKTRDELKAAGGDVHAYTADLADMAVRRAGAHGGEQARRRRRAGEQRRALDPALDRAELRPLPRLRAHDAAQLLRRAAPDHGLPAAHDRARRGHIINISSIGVLASSPRFSAYVASKAALDAFSRCAAGRVSGKGIAFTTINMPLVATPMIAPTKMYEYAPALEVEEAVDLIVEAVIHKPKRVATGMGVFMSVAGALFPKLMEIANNATYRMFPDSEAAKGLPPGAAAPEATSEQVALAALMKGVHF
jgi:NAD(P)-dependent dehydrogenase (short-subunit alcohol dehydrogenase family)